MLLAVLLAVAAEGAIAHALVTASRPAAGATVRAGTLAVELRFNSRIDGPRSRAMLVAPDGAATALSLAPGDSGAVLSGHADVRRAGAWAIRWQVLSLDGHVTRGEIPFRVEGAVQRP